ncbi:MAG: cystathionine beta-lyase [Alphaproteobacteria bacterium]|nr:cystathionine beta-lyase [Alphaproteobacteria bacterium]
MTSLKNDHQKIGPSTDIVHSGRHPHENHGFVNPPVYHASTIFFPSYEALKSRDVKYGYGRRGTPTMEALEEAVASLEGGYGSKICPSGLSAITTMLLSFLKAGDHLLVTDSTYRPTRSFCDHVLKDLGVETTYYDPMLGADIATLFKDNTKLVYTECPGSQTMEVQDIPAIVEAAHAKGILVSTDNTWSAGHYFKAFAHGCDISVQAGTKYIVGHSDAMLGTITVTEELWPTLDRYWQLIGSCAGPDDIYLGQRGLRTLDVRLERHMKNTIEIASWLQERDEVERVMYPALPSDPGHEIWKRDFSGASGLFSFVLKPVPEHAVAKFFNTLQFFGMGYSWGGYESLAVPFDPSSYRSATVWPHEGSGVRLHIGLEDVDDLKADLDGAFAAMTASA